MEQQQAASSTLIKAATGEPSRGPSLPPSLKRMLPDFLRAAASLTRAGARALRGLCRRRLLTSLEVPIRDPAYPWVMQWLVAKRKLGEQQQQQQQQQQQNAAVLSQGKVFAAPRGGDDVRERRSRKRGGGQHLLRYKGALLLIDRQRSGEVVDFSSGSPWETLTLTTLSLYRHSLQDLLPVLFMLVFAAAAEGVAESILADLMRFLSSSRWYFDRGIPYRRGYLLHGPPGCGKSSFVLALAGRLKYNICVLNVADPHLTDDRLQYLLATVPPRSLLLLEDIDGAIRRSEAAQEKETVQAGDRPSLTQLSLNPFGTRSVTFSGLLNALDGVVATEERIIFLTTNHPERLPDSLIRPGRVDLKVRIGFATPEQLRRQFVRFLPNATAEQADEFVSLLSPLQITMAELQGFFLFCRDDCNQALQMAKAWKEADQQVVQEMQLKQQQREMQQKQQQQQQEHQQQQQQQQSKTHTHTGTTPK
ncbi:Bcs1 protein, putative [Eimeria acervulina]|uniref:Bcs1 protein, putative n=1 Tax=Eimeria acervulina TaxID=5801 RepID=U6GT10_EIMAC|nr:Bcs1 protein, putative [Eimeria acervulina]CDI81719.1 Bcs1 protein, putative [Eimeria acervulina]